VVIGKDQELTAAGSKGIGLTNQLERVSGIGSEDDGIFIG